MKRRDGELHRERVAAVAADVAHSPLCPSPPPLSDKDASDSDADDRSDDDSSDDRHRNNNDSDDDAAAARLRMLDVDEIVDDDGDIRDWFTRT